MCVCVCVCVCVFFLKKKMSTVTRGNARREIQEALAIFRFIAGIFCAGTMPLLSGSFPYNFGVLNPRTNYRLPNFEQSSFFSQLLPNLVSSMFSE